MRDAERRLLRCIGEIDNELILEAEQVRFPARRWTGLLALAACLAVVISVPFLLSQEEKLALEPPAEQTQSVNKGAAGTEDMEAPAQDSGAMDGLALEPTILEDPVALSETFGGLQLGMEEETVAATLGEPQNMVELSDPAPAVGRLQYWNYDGLSLVMGNLGDGWFVNEIHVTGTGIGSLSTGITVGSSGEELAAAYPGLYSWLDSAWTTYDRMYGTREDHNGLVFYMKENAVSAIWLGPWVLDFWADPEPTYNLTSGELIHYEWRDKAWLETRIIDKAAKHICITMTISDPEEAFKEKDGVSRWIDFCNGTAVELRGDDIASVYTYTGESFDPDKLDGLTWHLEGRYVGLDNAVEQSLANPTETWDVNYKIESDPEEAPEG